jgi:hypothetical protein
MFNPPNCCTVEVNRFLHMVRPGPSNLWKNVFEERVSWNFTTRCRNGL